MNYFQRFVEYDIQLVRFYIIGNIPRVKVIMPVIIVHELRKCCYSLRFSSSYPAALATDFTAK